MSSTVLPEIIRTIDRHLSETFMDKDRSDRQPALTSAVLNYAEHDVIRAVIQAVCGDDGLIDCCARSSESHPLGFDKFVLLTSSLYELRLHIWWPGSARAEADVHNHRFSFASAVIAGGIEVSSYRLASPGRKMVHVVERRVRDSEYKYRTLGEVKVKRTATLALSKGSAYYMDTTELHRVQMLGEEMAATLFIRSRDERTSTSIMTERLRDHKFTAKREKLKSPEARRRLESFVDAIS